MEQEENPRPSLKNARTNKDSKAIAFLAVACVIICLGLAVMSLLLATTDRLQYFELRAYADILSCVGFLAALGCCVGLGELGASPRLRLIMLAAVTGAAVITLSSCWFWDS
jgi:hypothetical protein